MWDPDTGLDPSINPHDTYVVTDASVVSARTVSSTTPMVDPISGALVTSFTYTTPPEVLQLTAGYSYSGLPVATGVFPLDASMALGAAEVEVTRTIGGTSGDYNASGVAVYPASYEVAEGPDTLGAVAMVSPLLTDALVGGMQPPPSACLVSCGGGVATQTWIDDSTIITTSSGTSIAAAPQSVMTTFRRAPTGRWRAERLVLRWTQASASASVAATTTLVLRRRVEHVNEPADRTRRQRLVEHGASVSRVESSAGPPAAIPSTPGTLASAADPIPSIGYKTCGPQPYAGVRPPRVASGRGLVMAHGFLSDACVWYRMENNRIGTHYDWGQRLVENTTWSYPYDSQRDELITKMPTTTQNYVMIGHSNGGIVSRRVAQLAASSGVRSVLGVIAINSPHLGAPAADNPAFGPLVALAAAATAGRTWLCSRGKRGCGELTAITEPSGLLGTIVSIKNSGTLGTQMATTGPFRAQMAVINESFIRSAVVSHSSNRWLFMRFYGDFRCFPDDPTCGGRARVAGTERFYRHLRRTAVISALSALAAAATPFTAPLAGPMAQVAFEAGGMMAMLHLTNEFFLRQVVKSQDSDAVVPASSQRYPNVPTTLQQEIFGADTHVGSTGSPFVANRVDVILQDARLFNMRFRP